jgi:hypothetical protein
MDNLRAMLASPILASIIAPILLPPLLVFLSVDYSPGPTANRGHVVSAPHDGYDQYSGILAQQVARSLNWGWVKATGYRSYPLRHWFDVNRPTERRWRNGAFDDARSTARGRQIHADYLRKLRLASRATGATKLKFLVEIHGHNRSVQAGSGTLRIEAIELATQGFTRAELRRIKTRYDRLQLRVPQRYRVPLAIDRLDREYTLGNWIVPFHFYASNAKRTGSLRASHTTYALHFELPGPARNTVTARTAYTRLLANLIRDTAADVR